MISCVSGLFLCFCVAVSPSRRTCLRVSVRGACSSQRCRSIVAPCLCRFFAACRVHGWRRLECAAILFLALVLLQHSSWPETLQLRAAGRAPTRSHAMGIILSSAPASRNCAAHAAPVQIMHTAAAEAAKQKAGHLKRHGTPGSWGCESLFWRHSWTTSLGPMLRS